MIYTVGKYVIFFVIYSLLGALGETLFRLATEHHLYGVHGFLHLPLFPIYGLGALLVIKLLGTRMRHPVPLFFAGALLATVLEFVGHWLIEVIFRDRIWDYSSIPLNLYGRIDLYSSIGFGLGAIFLVYLIHPLVKKLVGLMPKRVTVIVATVASVILLTDFVYSTVERLMY